MIETIKHNSLQWKHISNPREADYDYLLKEYQFHPLCIEDCHETNQRPKIDVYPDYYFMILHFPYFDKGNRFVRIQEVKLFWGKDYIITIGNSHHWAVKKFFDEINDDVKEHDQDIDEIMSSSDILLYNILDRLMVETYTLTLKIGAEVDLVQYDIFNKKARSVIELISTTRRNIILLNTTFKPQLRVFHMFESGGIKSFIDQDVMDDYWGDLLDRYQKIYDMVEDYGELVSGLNQTFDSLQANKTNEIMKVLTIFSTTMLPLTMISGFFGMNFEFPFRMDYFSFWICVAIMILVTVFLLIYFNRMMKK